MSNALFPITDERIKENNQLYPVTHKFVKKDGQLYPVTHKFVVDEAPVISDFCFVIYGNQYIVDYLSGEALNFTIDWGDGTETESTHL